MAAHASNAGGKVTLLLGATRRADVRYTGDTAVCELRGEIAKVSGIDVGDQILICAGRKISPVDDDKLVRDVLKDGSKLMVRKQYMPGKSPVTQSSPEVSELRRAEETATQLAGRAAALDEAVGRHTQGFLDKEKTEEALRKDEREAKTIDEEAMKLLEVLDSLSFTEDVDRQRASRKALVRRIHEMLTKIDQLRDRIKMLDDDEYGEVARRRGNL